jgi:predicted flavoprotein YhiN
MGHKSEIHSNEWALIGHCIESGYGLVDQEGRMYPLDTHATPLIVSVLEESEKTRGIRLRIRREMRDQEMHTTTVEKI